jgi:PIN domain nuclease of toxin-antitoxin system
VKLLLDTHIWLWTVGDRARLHKRVAAAVGDAANEIWLSPVSVWETMMLIQRRRIAVDGDAAAWIERAIRSSSPREAPLTYEVALRSVSLKLTTRDPADRFLAATAAVHGLTLVTADKHLTKTKEFAVLAN